METGLNEKKFSRALCRFPYLSSYVKVSKHSDHIEWGPRTYMCEAATELDTGEYGGGMPEVCRAVLQQFGKSFIAEEDLCWVAPGVRGFEVGYRRRCVCASWNASRM